jgi:hypothetical protein
MANPTWPASLPDAPFAGTSREGGEDPAVLRTETEAGPAKMRRRYTAQVHRWPVTLRLTTAQAQTLDDFYHNTCQRVLPFDWVDVLYDATTTYRFLEKPALTALGAGNWQVRFLLEQLP